MFGRKKEDYDLNFFGEREKILTERVQALEEAFKTVCLHKIVEQTFEIICIHTVFVCKTCKERFYDEFSLPKGTIIQYPTTGERIAKRQSKKKIKKRRK